MPSIEKFNRTVGTAMDEFVTVYYAPDMQILWNRHKLFYIRTEEYKLENYVHPYSIPSSVEVSLTDAQNYADKLYLILATENNRILK